MSALLTPEDSKRVADALLDKIEEADLNLAYALRSIVGDFLVPHKNNWNKDWFPSAVCEFLDHLKAALVEQAYVASMRE